MQQYLNRYAETESRVFLDYLPGVTWRHVLVVPACNEPPDFPETLLAAPGRSGRLLLILVINQPAGAPRPVLQANRLLHDRMQSGLKPAGPPVDILAVDRFGPGRELPDGGVGLARKIGADIATALIHAGRVQSTWIHCTDADAVLPTRYFTAAESYDDASSLLYPFRHRGGDNQANLAAAALYEFSLRYYVAGLRSAGSPYAFHTIGSTMAVDAAAYAKVRGFPRRQAGEDFYLLNKLAKVGAVRTLSEGVECEPLLLSPRPSERVPFGTGPAISRWLEDPDPPMRRAFYHPAVFDALRQWLCSFPRAWESGSTHTDEILGAKDPVLAAALDEVGVQAALTHALRHADSEAGFMRHMTTWFDGFRTLKLTHALRAGPYPSVSLPDLVDMPPWRAMVDEDDALRASLDRALAGLDRLTASR